jgi:tetratricopeptide (TPR) repeat protein
MWLANFRCSFGAEEFVLDKSGWCEIASDLLEKIELQFSQLFLAFALIVNSAIAGETNVLSRSDELISEGATNFGKGDLDKAIADFTSAFQFDPTNTAAVLDRAVAYSAKGKYEKSIEDLNKYILLNPTNDLAFKNRASDFEGIGEFDKAISDWNEGLRLNPNDAIALSMRGYCYSHKEQFNESLKDYNQAIQIDAKCESAWNNLGWLRATCPVDSMRNGKEAVEAATKACEFSNWMKWGRIDTLAAAFAEAGDFQQAIQFQKQALGLNGATEKERKEMENRLALYQKQRPFRETSQH